MAAHAVGTRVRVTQAFADAMPEDLFTRGEAQTWVGQEGTVSELGSYYAYDVRMDDPTFGDGITDGYLLLEENEVEAL